VNQVNPCLSLGGKELEWVTRNGLCQFSYSRIIFNFFTLSIRVPLEDWKSWIFGDLTSLITFVGSRKPKMKGLSNGKAVF